MRSSTSADRTSYSRTTASTAKKSIKYGIYFSKSSRCETVFTTTGGAGDDGRSGGVGVGMGAYTKLICIILRADNFLRFRGERENSQTDKSQSNKPKTSKAKLQTSLRALLFFQPLNVCVQDHTASRRDYAVAVDCPAHAGMV